jgi:cytochrome c-type biogenesis protein CcmH/NrfG
MIRTNARLPALLLLASTVGCIHPGPPDPGAVAAAYAQAGQYREAAREIDIAVRSHPHSVALRRQAATIHDKAGNPTSAVGHLEAALQMTPSDEGVWLELGDLETRRDNAADAYVAYRRASELAPDEIRAVAGLALAAERLGFDAEAEAAYARWATLEAEGGSDSLPDRP